MPVAPKAVIASPSDDRFARVGADRGVDAADIAADIVMRDPADFKRCLAIPALVRNGAFALHLAAHRRATPDDLAPDDGVVAPSAWRLGLVIPKRYEASAVARNTIKRRWRAAFRRGRDGWASEFGGADVVVRMHSPLVRKAEAALAGPAKVRARERFDPQALFELLTTRLRGRHRAPANPAMAAVHSAVHS